MATNVPLERYKLDRSEQFDREKMAQSARQQDKKLAFAEKSAQKKMDRSERQAAGMMAYKGYKGTAGHIADGLDKHAAGMREDAKGRRKNGWEYAMEGLTEGLSTGLKMSAENEKIAKIMEYFKQTGDAAAQMNEYHEEKQQFQKSMEPSAQAAVSLAYSGKPYEVVDPVMRDLWNTTQANNKGLTGTYIGYVPNTSDIIVRDPEGNQQLVSLGEFAGKDYTKSQYEKSLLEQAEAVEARHQELQERKLSATEERNQIMGGNLDIRKTKMSDTQLGEFKEKHNASVNAEETINSMLEIAKRNPRVFSSYSSYVLDTGADANRLDYAYKQGLMSSQDKADIEQFNKAVNVLATDLAKGFTRQNMFLEKQLKNSIANITMEPQSVTKLLTKMKKNELFKRSQEMIKAGHNPYIAEGAEEMEEGGKKYLEDAEKADPLLMIDYHGKEFRVANEEQAQAIEKAKLGKRANPKSNDIVMVGKDGKEFSVTIPEQAEVLIKAGVATIKGAESTSPSNPITLTPEESQNAGKAVMPAKPANVPEGFILMVDPVSKVEQWIPPEEAEALEKLGAVRK